MNRTEIEKYNAKRLREFISSSEYRDMPEVPVSRQRALSWLKNPLMDPRDSLMYLARRKGRMIGYRCILPDRCGQTRFGWLSGNWVTPTMRRQGIASMLFDEACADWNARLMYTNYAEESKAVYDKTGRFSLYAVREGRRYYIRAASFGLLGGRNRFFRAVRPLLRLSDGVINLYQGARLKKAAGSVQNGQLMTESMYQPDGECFELLKASGRDGFCRRGQEVFEWIASWPWVMQEKGKDTRYFFSSFSPRYSSRWFKLRDPGGQPLAVLLISVIGEKMTVPYAWYEKDALEGVGRFLDHFITEQGISWFTTYNPEMTLLMQHSKIPMLGVRGMVRKYFATTELIGELPDATRVFIQDGDGDVVFT